VLVGGGETVAAEFDVEEANGIFETETANNDITETVTKPICPSFYLAISEQDGLHVTARNKKLTLV